MKPPSYWDELWHEANYAGDPKSDRKATGPLVGKSLAEFVAVVQLDAAADMRAMCADACEQIANDEEQLCGTNFTGAERCRAAILALPLTTET